MVKIRSSGARALVVAVATGTLVLAAAGGALAAEDGSTAPVGTTTTTPSSTTPSSTAPSSTAPAGTTTTGPTTTTSVAGPPRVVIGSATTSIVCPTGTPGVVLVIDRDGDGSTVAVRLPQPAPLVVGDGLTVSSTSGSAGIQVTTVSTGDLAVTQILCGAVDTTATPTPSPSPSVVTPTDTAPTVTTEPTLTTEPTVTTEPSASVLGVVVVRDASRSARAAGSASARTTVAQAGGTRTLADTGASTRGLTGLGAGLVGLGALLVGVGSSTRRERRRTDAS